jgi:hypothetical protein
LEELTSDPVRFQRTDGYERLLARLEEGCSPTALKEVLREDTSFAGDLLWTVCELDNVEPYVEEAALHLGSPDRGTAGYALEVVLRGAHDSRHLEAALTVLETAPPPVFEHGVLVLASQGLDRARDVFRVGGWSWAAEQVDELARGPQDIETTVEKIAMLVNDPGPDQAFVGLMIAVLASEQDERVVRVLEESGPEQFQSIPAQLRKMFQHRWRTAT